MNPVKFREALKKIMPGYSWIVHKSTFPEEYLRATGTQSAGFNRLSTLEIVWRKNKDKVVYEARSSGYGTRAKWLYECEDITLARVLRGLQDHYEYMVSQYHNHADALIVGRKPIKIDD